MREGKGKELEEIKKVMTKYIQPQRKTHLYEQYS
jgi:hypothetical protein